MKRIFALILAIFMAFSLLVACGETSQQEENRDSEQNDVEQSGAGYRDFYEQEFKGLFFIGTDSNNMFWPEPKTESKERTRKISEELQEVLNCVLTEEGTTSTINTAFVQTKFATGDYAYTWASLNSNLNPLPGFYKAGFIQSWNDIPTVDLEDVDKWGSAVNRANATFNGEQYADVGSSVTGGGNGRLIVNYEMVTYFNAADPQALLEQGTWTWDTFDQYLESVSEFSDSSTIYGMSVWSGSVPAQLPLACVFSNGGQVIRFDSTGKGRFALTDADALEGLEYANKLRQKESVIMDGAPYDLWAKKGATFILGNSAFGVSSSGASAHWGLDNLDDIRFLPFPYGPKAEYGKTSATFSGAAGGTVIFYGWDKEDAGYIWNVKKEIGEKYATDTTEEWKRKTFFTEESYNNYMQDSINFNLTYATHLGTELNSQMLQVLDRIAGGSVTAQQGLGSISTLIQTAVDENLSN